MTNGIDRRTVQGTADQAYRDVFELHHARLHRLAHECCQPQPCQVAPKLPHIFRLHRGHFTHWQDDWLGRRNALLQETECLIERTAGGRHDEVQRRVTFALAAILDAVGRDGEVRRAGPNCSPTPCRA